MPTSAFRLAAVILLSFATTPPALAAARAPAGSSITDPRALAHAQRLLFVAKEVDGAAEREEGAAARSAAESTRKKEQAGEQRAKAKSAPAREAQRFEAQADTLAAEAVVAREHGAVHRARARVMRDRARSLKLRAASVARGERPAPLPEIRLPAPPPGNRDPFAVKVLPAVKDDVVVSPVHHEQ